VIRGTAAASTGVDPGRPDPSMPDLSGLPDLDLSWSRYVVSPDADGVDRTWHLLDNQAEPRTGTMLCVHGNPTWSFLWRRFMALAPPGWRVVAVDHLGMGLSERTLAPRRLADRITDLGRLTETLGITGPVVTVAHDWGGPISLGWAQAHRDQVLGMVLTNTGVNLPPGSGAPGPIKIARTAALRDAVCVRTPIFLRAATALSRPALPRPVRRGLELPYGSPDRRRAIGDFVADIPVEPGHPSRPALDAVAAGMTDLADLPALILWGPRDPVFTERQLDDLLRRLPKADVQRYARASHLVTEDVPEAAADVWRWVADRTTDHAKPDHEPESELEFESDAELEAETEPRLPWAALLDRAHDPAPAVVELSGGLTRSTSFAELEDRILALAAGLSAEGVRPGQRVAILIPPGVDLTVAVYAVWRLGAVIVVADAGLGLRGLGHALRSAAPDHVIGIGKALLAASALSIPGRRIPARRMPTGLSRALGWGRSLPELTRSAAAPLGEGPTADAEAAVLFTSGATGPAKGVVYRHSQLRAQIDQVGLAMGLTGQDRLVAAFAPFALYGPALGMGAAVPDMDVTSPGTLTARALADAVAAVDATVVFASPAALKNVVATRGDLSPEHRTALSGVRRLMSAGAPVPLPLLRQMQTLLPGAELHTPYGMTEALPVADIDLAQIEAAGPGNGVCVGRPLPGVLVLISPLDHEGRAEAPLAVAPYVTGEICISAAHVKQRYDRLWATERSSSRNPGWHRSGDVGHFDDDGRLWVEGRLVHVVTTAAGPVTPVGVEQRVEALPEVDAAAVAGVGPAGTQQVILVVVPAGVGPSGVLAGPELSSAVRTAAGIPVAAVLVATRLPVDIRHASKVDRAAVARWADRILSGQRAGRL